MAEVGNYLPEEHVDDLFLEVHVPDFDGNTIQLKRLAARHALATQCKTAYSLGWRRWAGCFHADGDYYHMHLIRQTAKSQK